MRTPGCDKLDRPARRTSRTGHTLIELVVGLAVVSVIMGAMVSTMLIAARAIDGNAAEVCEAGNVVDQITADLSLAQGFNERQSNAVTVIVPDRDGDGQAETIRYSWSGTAGTALLRQYNGQEPLALAENVHHFSLAYLLNTVQAGSFDEPPPGSEEGEETVLIHHDNAPGGSLASYRVRGNRWCAQYFRPVLPEEAVSWKITYIRIRARRSGASSNGVFAVQIRTADASHRPTSTVLAETLVNEASLGSSFTWVTANLGPLVELDPSSGYCVVVRHMSGRSDVARIEYERNGNPMTANTHWMTTNNGGESWSTPNDSRDMRFFVYGTVTQRGS